MKCPNCSFNNIAKAEKCKICGTELDIPEGENTDTLSLDEALKAIYAGKAKASLLTDDADDFSTFGTEDAASQSTTADALPAWELLNDEADEIDEGDKADEIDEINEIDEAESRKSQKRNFVPVFEASEDHCISPEDDADNLLVLPMDGDIDVFVPEKRRASKMDEIAGIAVILLVIALIVLIFVAIRAGKSKQPEPIVVTNTTPPITEPTTIPTTTTTAAHTTTPSTTAASETATTTTTTTTPAATPFDEWYFVKSGSVSNGDGTNEDILSKIRMGDHLYFHRIVFDFLGDSIPTYTVSILEGGYLVELRVANITDYTGETGVAEWSNIAENIEIIADTPDSIIVNIRMSEPVMISTYGLEEPGRIIIDIRGDSNLD